MIVGGIDESYDVYYRGLPDPVAIGIIIGRKIEKDKHYYFNIGTGDLIIPGNEIFTQIRRLSCNQVVEIKGSVKCLEMVR